MRKVRELSLEENEVRTLIRFLMVFMQRTVSSRLLPLREKRNTMGFKQKHQYLYLMLKHKVLREKVSCNCLHRMNKVLFIAGIWVCLEANASIGLGKNTRTTGRIHSFIEMQKF